VVEPYDLGGGVVGVQDGGHQLVDLAAATGAGGDGDLGPHDPDLDRSDP
jgi:hypothetical protein